MTEDSGSILFLLYSLRILRAYALKIHIVPIFKEAFP